ncbi:protein containing tetratricopeptide [Winogradskyella psychrotolerans RS-3]|uniref:Protein containing tetratricopeptide n=1 Tax=Winogradskyella psychrotolerans RS-3 TaxID=641526 RepID=S7VJW5_9FLAO|nr:tetratricopeptide repeat protein [Winogradskyella psychrotolerans]EPR69782.1 protein containing tetratricopeptide [Winogradskyella psychrotolerans RS-3]
MKLTYSILFTIFYLSSYAQPNCDAFIYYGDTLKYKACKKAEETKGHYQFSKRYQEILDESIAIDSTFAYAYREKSTAYLKSGDFITWKELIDKAVKHNFKENLGYRGWCRYQFFKDYQGAIEDIEELENKVKFDIGFSANGDYHLNIAKALCYKAIGQKEKAIEIINKQLNSEDHFLGAYDYLHLGVLYLEQNEFEKAIEAFNKQTEDNELAENQFYLALTYKVLQKPADYKTHLNEAKVLYLDGRKMFDPYTNPMDKIFLEDIENEFKESANKN